MTEQQQNEPPLLAAALDYAAAGLHLFPAAVEIIPETRKKKARFLPNWNANSSRDQVTLKSWFGRRGAWQAGTLCIDCAKSDLVVIDCDRQEGIANWAALVAEHNIGATWVARTPSGGQHWYFRADPNHPVGIDASGKVAPSVDVRGAGGLVFAPPSRDKRGTYHWVEGVPEWDHLPVVPQIVIDRMTEPKHGRADSTRAPDGAPPHGRTKQPRRFTNDQAIAFCRPHVEALRTARDGGINDQLNTTAIVLGHFVPEFWTRSQAEGVLLEALSATVYDGRTWNAENTIASGLDAAARDWIAVKIDAHGKRESTPSGTAEPQRADGPDPRTERLPTLPDDFWQARPMLSRIRQAAHARGRSGDLVFYANLARLSAMVSHELVFNSGIGVGSLNTFVAAVGPSGMGKSTGADVAHELLPTPRYLRPADGSVLFRDGLPIGSGEGLAEAYMGVVTRAIPGEYKQNGDPRTEKVRAQVRHNAFVYVDEGEALIRMAERAGSTVGPTIRSAWNAQLLGQANASEERIRILPARSYSLGLVIGFQRHTCQPLLADATAGTPQRFLWCAAVDQGVPDQQPDSPGQLTVHIENGLAPVTGTIRFAPEIRAELWRGNLARVRGEVEVAELDSHEPLMRCKVAALLAVLDERMDVTVADWDLARIVWETSCAVRDQLIAHGKREAAKERWVKESQYIERQVRAAAEVGQVDAKLDRIGDRLVAFVGEDGSMPHWVARKKLAYRDRSLYEPAVDRAAAAGKLRRVEGGITTPLRAV